MLRGVRRVLLALPVTLFASATSSALAAGDAGPVLAWAPWTASPTIVTEATNPGDAELLARCGAAEAGLREAARRIAESRLPGAARIDLDRLDLLLRVSGEPHVWPRAWVVTGHALDHDATLAKMDAWRASFRDEG